jgi:hypothetical protein
MLIRLAFLALSIILLFCLSSTSFNNIDVKSTDLSSCIPHDDEIPGWFKEDVHRIYKGESLYEYINGGAEIYHEYGFKQVITQDYSSKASESLSLEIFEMDDDTAAYGIYTFKTGTTGKRIPLGNQAVLESYYINVWQAHYVVTISAFSQSEEMQQVLITFAEFICKKLPAGGKPPGLITLLPEENNVEGSLKYIEGKIALYNYYHFSGEDIFQVEKAVRQVYKSDNLDYQLFVFKYQKLSKCQEILQKAENFFKNSDDYKSYKKENGMIYCRDKKENLLLIANKANYIVIYVGTPTIEKTKEIMQSIMNDL